MIECIEKYETDVRAFEYPIDDIAASTGLSHPQNIL